MNVLSTAFIFLSVLLINIAIRQKSQKKIIGLSEIGAMLNNPWVKGRIACNE